MAGEKDRVDYQGVIDEIAQQKAVYNPSLMNAVRGIASIPGAMATEMGLGDKASRLWGGIKNVAMSAGGQMAAQAASPTYVNPPGGLFRTEPSSLSTSTLPLTGAPESLAIDQKPTVGGMTGQNPAVPSTPAAPVITQPATTEKPPTQGWWAKEGWGISGKGGQTPLGEQPTAVRVTKGTEEEPTTLVEAMGVRDLQKSPEQIAKEQQIVSGGRNVGGISGIDSQIAAIKADPNMRVSGGGLRAPAWRIIAELEKAKQTALTASEGHGVTAQGHQIAAKERTALERDRLTETKRYHDILSMNAKDKIENDKFMREEATRLRQTQGEDNLMKTYGAYENALGEKSTHPAIAMFKLIDSGYDVNSLSKQWQATAAQVREGFRAFATKAKAANPKLTPAQIKAAYYDELRGAK